MAPWTIGLSAVAAALFLTAAYYLGSSPSLAWRVGAPLLALFGVAGLLDTLVSRIVLDAEELIVISLVRRRRYPRASFVGAKVDGGGVFLQRHDGGWLSLPSTGHNALAVRNTIHAWIRRKDEGVG